MTPFNLQKNWATIFFGSILLWNTQHFTKWNVISQFFRKFLIKIYHSTSCLRGSGECFVIIIYVIFCVLQYINKLLLTVQCIGLKIIYEEQVSIIINTITQFSHFFTTENLFFFYFKSFYQQKLGIVWYFLIWIFRCNHRKLQNHWTVEVFIKNCEKKCKKFNFSHTN